MEEFKNSTTAGNERAIRRGKVVPPDAVNIAWAKSPSLTPDKNVAIVDYSQLIPENFDNDKQQTRCRIMFANHSGVLIDAEGNEIVRDEFPAVTDVFSKDEDFSFDPSINVEYEERHIMPFLHVSRYFHIDTAGLDMPHTLFTPNSNPTLKVVREDGSEYLNEFGEKAYRIQLAQLRINYTKTDEDFNSKSLYRVHVYIDTEAAEGLFLQYFKAEWDEGAQNIKKLDINYKEKLNPYKFYQYVPEESELADHNFKRFRQYSSKPSGGKEGIIGGGAIPSINGYKIHVPKRAIPDPRIFQLFRWRVRCDFVDSYKTETVNEDGPFVRCGILHDPGHFESNAPLTFFNLEKSSANFRDLVFVNPLKNVEASSQEKANPDYWKVNIRTVTQAQLRQFDILLFTSDTQSVDFNVYYPKIADFVYNSGGTVLSDSTNNTYYNGYPFPHSKPIRTNGTFYDGSSGTSEYTTGTTVNVEASGHDILDGSTKLAGFDLSDVSGTLFSMRTQGAYRSRNMQVFDANTVSSFKKWTTILSAPLASSPSTNRAVLAIAENFVTGSTTTKGAYIHTTLGFAKDISMHFDESQNIVADYSNSSSSVGSTLVYTAVSRAFQEEMYKLMYNICLYALQKKPTSTINDPTTINSLRVSSGESYSTRWSAYSDWTPSWVIDGAVLTEDERTQFDFNLAPVQSGSTELVWQRKLSDRNLKQLIDKKLGEGLVERLKSADRVYVLETSNDGVSFPGYTLDHNTIPHAYTDLYSPPFKIPLDLGPHKVMGEEVEGVYAQDSAKTITYPPRGYRYRVDATVLSPQNSGSETGAITVTGTATIKRTTTTPRSTEQTRINWASNGSGNSTQLPNYSHYNMFYPDGIHTWQYSNYNDTSVYGRGSLSWITPGLLSDVRQGSRGIMVKFVQQAMNVFKFWGFFPAGAYLQVDGIFGSKTHATVLSFQSHFRQRDVTGIVNAETVGVITSQIIRLRGFIKPSNIDYERWFTEALRLCQLENISDGTNSTAWVKRTWSNVRTAPTIAWDMLAIRFDEPFPINTVELTPYTMGTTPTIRWESIHVLNTSSATDLRNKLHNYNSTNGQYIYMRRRPQAGKADRVPIGPITGNTIILGIAQDIDSGYGGTRVYGVTDVSVYAKTAKGGQTTTVTETVPISHTKTMTVDPDEDKYFTPYLDKADIPIGATVTNVVWNSVSSGNAKLRATLQSGNSVRVENTVSDGFSSDYRVGPIFPDYLVGDLNNDGTLDYGYSMNKYGNLSAAPESGTIKKSDGLKIFCTRDKRPNWNSTPPAGASSRADSLQTEYTEFIVIPKDNEPTVTVGFYDIVRQEFIFDSKGVSRITAAELAARGRHNVFVAAITEYQKVEDTPIPPEASTSLPYKWAMPVYGVCEKVSSRIGIEPLAPGLDKFDIWPVGIRVGKFARDVSVRNGQDGPLAGWVANYRGRDLRAFYSVPEADKAGWSPLLGRPYIDIKDETPIILGNKSIQVRQAPIAILQEPTLFSGPYDPARPFFKVYTRPSTADAWVEVQWADIVDYKVANGKITLRYPIPGGGTGDNVKVSYSTKTEVFPFKFSEGKRLNLNPYASITESYINKPVYIYILPKMVLDTEGEVIVDSVLENTLRFTTDPTIFSKTHPDYNPLAIKLGVVYVNNGSDIRNLILLDTRVRGGGLSESIIDEDALNEFPVTKNHWDISPGTGLSYQSGGLVILRLPEELKDQFPDDVASQRIRELIRKWMPAGVEYKLEYLDGTPWED